MGLLVASLVAALSGALVPGPVFVVTVSESLKRGGVAGPLIVAGHLMVEAIIIVLIFLGLGAVLGSASARAAVGYLGGATLILMGLFLAKASRALHLDVKTSAKARFVSHGPLIAGVLSSGSNPHILLWWLTIGMPIMYTSITVAGVAGFLAFLVGHAGADLGWFWFVSYSVDKGKKFLSQRTVSYLVFGSAIFLFFFGIWFLYSTYVS